MAALLCPKCGKLVPSVAPGGVCPACLTQIVTEEGITLPPSAVSRPTGELETVGTTAASVREDPSLALDAIRIPGYEILSQLGRGGMGVVYKACHLDLKRFVALKMIVGGEYATREQLARFRREAEAVARLQHPNIVQIYEVGERDGRPYFSLEFVDGGSLADKLRGTPLPPAEAAGVVATLARAVHAAHQRGIVHRDLKPANVLLTTDGTPKITDFGVAKETDNSSSRTQEGTVVGTPSYMAPEQADGATGAIGPAADTYALGAILYETLTGRPPFKGVTSLDTILQVISLEPAPPRGLQPQVPADLETICLKCLHKDPARRYASARELAEDLQRFLGQEPILARPARPLERLVKWSRRRPAVATLSAALIVMVAAAFALVTWRWRETERAAGLERDGKVKAEQLALQSKRAVQLEREGKVRAVLLAQHSDRAAQEANKRAEAEKLLKQQADLAASDAKKREQAEVKRREEVASLLEKREQVSFTSQIWRAANLIDSDPKKAQQILLDRSLCPPERCDFAWRYQYQLSQRLVKRMTHMVLDGGIHRADFSAGGKLLAAVTKNEQVRLWDLESGKAGVLLHPNHGDNKKVGFAVDGKALSTTGGMRLAWSPDGKTLATGGADGVVKLWEMPAGKLLKTLTWQIPDDRDRPRQVYALAFDPSGTKLAVGGNFYDEAMHKKKSDNRFRYFVVWVWDIPGETGKLIRTHDGVNKDFFHENCGVNTLLYSPDGTTLAVGLTSSGAVLMLDPGTGALRQVFRTAGFTGGMSFSPDGKMFAFGNTIGNVHLIDLTTGKNRHILYGHLTYAGACAFTDEGALVTGSNDGTMRVWDPGSGQLRTILRAGSPVSRIVLRPQDQQVVAATAAQVQFWSLRALAPAVAIGIKRPGDDPPKIAAVAFDEQLDEQGPRFAVVGHGKDVLLFRLKQEPAEEEISTKVSVKPDGKLTGHKSTATAVAFGPPGSKFAVSGSVDGQILVWRLDEGKPDPIKVLSGHDGMVTQLAVLPDRQSLISGGADGTARLWDLKSGQQSQPFAAKPGGIVKLALSTDGKRLAAVDRLAEVSIWDVEKRALVRTLASPKLGPIYYSTTLGPILQLAWNADDTKVATVHQWGIIVHDLTAGTTHKQKFAEATSIVLQGAPTGFVAVTPDLQSVAAACADRTVRVYDVVSGHLRCEMPVLSHEVYGLGFNRDASVLATISIGKQYWDHEGEIKLWAAP